jgi:effector-binding domain-containing protein
MSQIEMLSYKIIQRSGSIEVREYSTALLAEVDVMGEREKAINAGFRVLADYIFGNNQPRKSIAMTAPVSQTQEGNLWKVTFTMPSVYNLENLPKPNNPGVKIISRPPYRAVVIKFSGFWTKNNLQKHLAQLENYVKSNQLKTIGESVYLFYNPPWTLPFLRRNEISYRMEAD